MVWYEKKKDILARLGKGEKDVRYLERMIRIGKVVKRWSEYALAEEVEEKILVDSWEVIRLQKVVDEKEELLKQYEEVHQVYKDNIKGLKAEVERLQNELKNWEANINMEYYKKLYEDTERELNDIKFRKKWATWNWLRKKFRVGEEQYEAFSEEWDSI